MRKCKSQSMPLGVATISQTSSSWAASESLSPLGTQCLQSPAILLGEGGVWTSEGISKLRSKKVMSHPRSLEYRNKECCCALRLCHRFMVSLGYIDQSALGNSRGLTMLLCADAMCRDRVQVQPKDLHREPEEKAKVSGQ